MRGVVPLWWVVIVGKGQAPEMLPLVVAVAVETFRMVVVVVMVMGRGMMIRTWMILDPGWGYV